MNYLVELIIRPARNLYHPRDLGDTSFSFGGQDFKRIDFNAQIKNNRGEKLSCSFWCPLEMSSKELAYSPCIIYCHGNAGNKIDIIEIFEFLSWEFNICSFDFSGAGYSEGQFVTLGFQEKDDIKAVADFLRNELNIQKIILYGRSMGAVSSLRYAAMDPNIKAIVLDSPFGHFPQLCKEILSNKFYIPNVVSSILIDVARNKILEKLENFDINDFLPSEDAKQVQVPTIIIHGLQDSLVGIDHSREIFKNLPKNTYKKLLEVEGDHNDCRAQQDVNIIRDFIMQFAYDSLVIKEHKRRLNIKNAHLNYTAKYGININMIINNFRNSIKSQMINGTCGLNGINIQAEKRKMNNFNIIGQMKKKKIISRTDETKPLDKIRSKSSDTIDSIDVLSSKHKKENMTRRNFKRNSSNNNKFKKSEDFNTNIKMIKYHDYGLTNQNSNQNIISYKLNDKIDDNCSNSSKNKLYGYEDFEKDKISIDSSVVSIKNINPYVGTDNSLSLNQNEQQMNTCININPSKENSNPLNESQAQIDNMLGNRNNLTFSSFPSTAINRNRLRSERNNILGGILGCEVRVKSDQITFTNLDKSSIRKKSCNDLSASKLNETVNVGNGGNSGIDTTTNTTSTTTTLTDI